MTPDISTSSPAHPADIKQVPQETSVRRSVRRSAAELATTIDPGGPASRVILETQGRILLNRLSLPEAYLGFAMVAISNEFWLNTLASVPYHRRLFLLPHCLADKAACAGGYDSVGLNCAGCGSCSIHQLKVEAEQLGYQVIVAEGTSSVLMKILEGQADAIVGVACLDSLEKSFHRIVDLGVPHVAIPLLKDGCAETVAEIEQIRAMLQKRVQAPRPPTRTYLPLLRQTMALFQEPLFGELLLPHTPEGDGNQPEALTCVHRIAHQWLREGGKRLRPFVTVASYAVARHGMAVLRYDPQSEQLIPPSMARIALAIESMHKASLVHDDIEDGDDYRYGRETVHKLHGLSQAVNIGDYLIGLGYRLIAGETQELGAECISDILSRLSVAHMELCRGQGAELRWHKEPTHTPRSLDVLTMYALKTAPAFEVAIYAGLRAAGVKPDLAVLRRLATYLGEAFQIINDLDDWRADDRNKITRGLDALAGRPTILRCLAAEGGAGQQLSLLNDPEAGLTPEQRLERVGRIYTQYGVFDRCHHLLEKLRQRAISAAGEMPTPDLQELMRFLVSMVLPPKSSPHPVLPAAPVAPPATPPR